MNICDSKEKHAQDDDDDDDDDDDHDDDHDSIICYIREHNTICSIIHICTIYVYIYIYICKYICIYTCVNRKRVSVCVYMYTVYIYLYIAHISLIK